MIVPAAKIAIFFTVSEEDEEYKFHKVDAQEAGGSVAIDIDWMANIWSCSSLDQRIW